MTDLKYLACSDTQFPLHDQRTVTLWLNVLKKFKPDIVDFVGDIDNADPTGRWAAGSAEELFYNIDMKNAELDDLEQIALKGIDAGGAKDTREFVAQVRKIVPNADIKLHDGNHGWTRHEKYFLAKAPGLMERISPDTLYGLTNSGVEFHRYDDLPVKRFHDLYIHHGQAVSKHSGESVKADMDAWGVSLIRGHSHRVGDYHKTYELTGSRLEGYEIGHMMDENKATYMNQRNWQQGFIYGLVTESDYHMELVKVKNHECYVAGRKFSA